jgi:hypothetical protein
MYQKKHYARDDNEVEELRAPEEECDWQIDMPDGDEIDDIVEASVDDDSVETQSCQLWHYNVKMP